MNDSTASQRGPVAIAAAFDRAHQEGRCALITYLTLGYPSMAESLDLVPALVEGGADIIELGVPFSDPVADGPAIQKASQVALENGITPAKCLDLVATLRGKGVSRPLLLMGYYNPILRYGIDAYAQTCAQVGVDGLIIPDLPPEEAGLLGTACEAHDLALVFLVSPTTDEQRMAQIARASRGFLYVVSRLGATGTGRAPQEDLTAYLQQVRRHAHMPMAVGFGISRAEQIVPLRGLVDGVIVGSAIVEQAVRGATAVRELVASLHNGTYIDGA